MLSLLTMCRVHDLAPTAPGVKVTEKVVLPPYGNVESIPSVFNVKSPGFAPDL